MARKRQKWAIWSTELKRSGSLEVVGRVLAAIAIRDDGQTPGAEVERQDDAGGADIAGTTARG